MLNFCIAFSERNYWTLVVVGAIVFVAAIELGLRRQVVSVRNITPNLVHEVYSSEHETVALGDSHIYRAFIHADGILNLGRGGLSTRAIRRIGEAYFRHRRTGRAIVGVGPQLLARPIESSRFDHFFGQHNRFGFGLYAFEPGINSHANWFINPDKRSKAVNQHAQNLRIGGHWRAVAPEKKASRIKDGMQHQRPRWQDIAVPALAEINTLLHTLQSQGVQTCLLLTPLAADYRSAIDRDEDFSRAMKAFVQLAKNTQVRLVDSQALSMALPDGAFINHDHLASTHSAAFSNAVHAACFDDGAA